MYKPAVAFIGFNRPDCTRVAFEAIRRYRPEKLFLVADGPRPAVPTDQPRCEAVREIMKSVDWECEVKTNFSETNLGCKKRMSSGIDWVFSQVEEAILLEDDCVPCPDFFRFCSEMLVRYRDNPKVMSIAGTNYQAGQVRGDASYYFSRYPHIWGWASWRRAWKNYDVAMSWWPKAKQEKWIEKICPPAEQAHWTSFFNRVYEGKIDTWDCQWVYTCWRCEGVGIIPNANLITNIGAGPEATHTKGEVGSLEIATGTLGELVHPTTMVVDAAADKFTFDTHFGGGGHDIKEPLKKQVLNFIRHKPAGLLRRVVRKLGFQISRIQKLPGDHTTGVLNFGPYQVESHSQSQLNDYASAPSTNQFLARLAACLGDSDPELGIIDVGANCGDTAAIIRSRSKQPILCIEGDAKLYALLQTNALHLPDVTLINSYLGEVTGAVPVMIQKEGWNNTLIPNVKAGSVVQIVRLDELSHAWLAGRRVGLLKVDTEGFDVPILFGAKKLLEKWKPIVAFEYNRDSMDATGEPGLRVFSYLDSLGYDSLMIYDNYGRYFMTTTVQNLKLLTELHRFVKHPKRGIYYFDLVAFPKGETKLFQKFKDAEMTGDPDKY